MKHSKYMVILAAAIAGVAGYLLGQNPEFLRPANVASGAVSTGSPVLPDKTQGVGAAQLQATTGQNQNNSSQARQGGQGGAQGGGQRGGPAPVEVSNVRMLAIQDNITTIGTLLANETAQIAAETGGRVMQVNSEDGQPVSSGDVLFVLDGELLQAEVKDAQARLALAKTAFTRNDTLRKSRNITQSVFDQSVAELAQAQTAADLAQVKLDKLTIRAPFSGVLGFRQVSEGAYVTPGMPLVTVAQIDTLQVSGSFPELAFPHVKIGGIIELTADAAPGRMFRATISAIDPEVDINGRALKIRAKLDNADLALRPGMLTRIQVISPDRQAVTVSESAIVPLGEKVAVYTVEDDKAKRVNVTTGARRDGWVEITSGLAAGNKVVTAGGARLADGAPVKIVKSTMTE